MMTGRSVTLSLPVLVLSAVGVLLAAGLAVAVTLILNGDGPSEGVPVSAGSSSPAATPAPRMSEAAVTGALASRVKTVSVDCEMDGGPRTCTVDLYVRIFCNIGGAKTATGLLLRESVFGESANRSAYQATWDGLRSRWEIQAGCRPGGLPLGKLGNFWYYEDRNEFVGADLQGVNALK